MPVKKEELKKWVDYANREGAVIPVSYTHLDVYKRQDESKENPTEIG